MSTHTYAKLEVSDVTYNEIEKKLREAGYDHAFIDDAINMHGIGLVRRKSKDAESQFYEDELDPCDCKIGDCVKHYRRCLMDNKKVR